jgi:hypothetical protein
MLLESIAPLARMIFACSALTLLAIIVAMIRGNSMREKYALLWLPLGMALLILSLFPEGLVWLSAKIRLHYITVVLLGVIVVFTTILLYFTARMSQLREDVKKLAQELALLRAQGQPSSETAARDSSVPAWTPVRPVEHR